MDLHGSFAHDAISPDDGGDLVISTVVGVKFIRIGHQTEGLFAPCAEFRSQMTQATASHSTRSARVAPNAVN